ncbi:MAG: T9SS type A sorting domain-containing protein [Bacteroidales bacterium]
MKNTFRKVASLQLLLIAGITAYGQCVPDTANCKDTGEPGEICPRYLPEATVNTSYDETITIIPPGEAVVNETSLDIVYIQIDSVINIPDGIDYFPNATKFYADSAYCIQITGTPTTAGEFDLAIYVSPFIFYLNDTIKGPQVVNDTSVTMVVHEASGIDPYRSLEFQVIQNVPNPFSEVTRLGFYTPFDDRIELNVFNILGELMYQEKRGAPPGKHYFDFDGSSLQPGTYFYRISNSSGHYTGKFIKSR